MKELLIDYAPNKQHILCKDTELCYFGDSPTLARINREYNEIAAQAWLIPQLTDIAEFSNCKSVFGKGQIRSCADMIVGEYYHLKITELMLFFYKFKAGYYGQFYGAVSPMVIMCSLKSFMRDRNEAIFQHDSMIDRKKMEESCKGAITYQEYMMRKEKFNKKTYNNDKD